MALCCDYIRAYCIYSFHSFFQSKNTMKIYITCIHFATFAHHQISEEDQCFIQFSFNSILISRETVKQNKQKVTNKSKFNHLKVDLSQPQNN